MTKPLRIAHISDTHLGYRALPHQDPLTGRNQRSIDVERAFSAAIDDILRQNVDLVIHGGDVFHHSRPNWHSVRHFVMEMRRIERAGIPSVVIAGNHDTPRYRAGGSVFSVLEVALPNVHISAGYEEEEFTFDALDLRVQTVPHGALTNPDKPVVHAVPDTRNILVTHGMTAGILDPGRVTEPGEQELDNDLFEADFDYIALGHYHISTKPFTGAWYSGSTERFGWGDFEVTPGYLLVELGETGLVGSPKHRSVTSRPMHLLKPVYGDSLSADEMVENVVDQLDRLDKSDSLTRVQIRDANRQAYRQVERQLRRDASGKSFHLTVSRQAPAETGMSLEIDQDIAMQDLKSLFAEFVGVRKGEHYSGDFATRFLERGTQAIDDAQRIVNESQTEGTGA